MMLAPLLEWASIILNSFNYLFVMVAKWNIH